MAFKKYAYYNKGNKFAIVESEMSGGSGNLAVAHCTLSGYSTKDTCEAAGGQWIPSSSASSSGIWEKYISPKESVSDGIEIEYSYAPTFNLQSTGTEGTDFYRFIGWGSDGGNLLLFTVANEGIYDISSLFTEGDWIYIEGSSRWSGLHQVKTGVTSHRARGILTLETKCNLPGAKLSVTGTFATDETFNGDNAAADMDIEAFKDQTSARDERYIFVDGASDAENGFLHSLSSDDTSGQLTFNRKYYIDTDGDYTSKASTIAADSGDAVVIYNVFYEQLTVYEGVEVLQDESFELDLSDYQAQAVIYYLKAKIAEDLRDVEAREYFMRLFRKQIEKASSSRKRGPYMVQGFSGMRNY